MSHTAPLTRTNLIAFLATIPFAGVALTDALMRAITGSFFVGGGGVDGNPLDHFFGLTHFVGYAAVVVVLLTVARPVFTGRRFRQVLRWITVVASLYLAVGFAVATVRPTTDLDIAGIFSAAFLITLIVPGILGITMLTQGDRTPSAWLLAAQPVALIAIILFAALGPEQWAHPAWAEVLGAFGLTLLGWRAVRTDPTPAVSADDARTAPVTV